MNLSRKSTHYERILLLSANLSIRHLHAQYIAVDANFRLKQKERGFSNSGTLGPGWGYFADPICFSRELQRVSSTPQATEVSSVLYHYGLI